MAVVLETEHSRPGHVLIRSIELVLRLLSALFDRRIPMSFGPLVQIHADDTLIVHRYDDAVVKRHDRHAVPFARLLDDLFGRGKTVIDRTALTRVRLPVRIIVVRIGDLNLNTGMQPFLDIGRANEDAAVGSFGDFEFKVENEITVLVLRPDVTAAFAS